MNKKELTLGSLFDGSGGFPLGGILAGIKPVWNSEIESFPIRVTEKRLPEVKHYGDVNKLNGANLPPVDIITFGSPCQDMSIAGKRTGLEGSRSGLFYQAIRIIEEMREATNSKYPRYAVWENVCFDADTLVTCENGYKRISDISIGDKVKTHKGRYCPVVKVHQNKKKIVIKLSISGGEDIIVTSNHPILVRKKLYKKKSIERISEPEWVSAGELTKEYLVGYSIDRPTLPDDFITDAEAWAIGRWIADGSVDLSKCNPRMFFSIGKGKEPIVREVFRNLPYDIYENKPHPTATNFCFTSHEFYTLISDAGRGAGNKRVPSFVFKLPYHLQKAVLDGYIAGDGYIRNRHNCTELSAGTASRELAYGICRLLRNVYRVASNISIRYPSNGMIQGREIKANHPNYCIYATLTNKSQKSYRDENIIWQPVKSVEIINEKKTVYNLSVLEDNTYEANGIIVHNCGAFSSNKGEDFRAVLESFCKIKDSEVHIPRLAKWHNAGEILGDDFSVAWRVFDSQYWGIPQRRKRIYLVADFDGTSAGKILFESEGLSRYSAESFNAWKNSAGSFTQSTGTSGKICLNDQGGNRMDITDEMTSTLRAESHHPPVVLASSDSFVSPQAAKAHSLHCSSSPQQACGLPGTPLESAGFCTEHSAKSRSIGYEKEKSPTLRAGVVPAAVIDNHSQDTRYKVLKDVAPTVSATYGMGGNNQPFVVEKTYDVRFTSEGTKNARQNVYETSTARTIDTGGIPPDANQGGIAVVEAYGICSKDSNAMKSDKPNSGFYKAETSRTIDGNGGNPSCNQGGIAVVAVEGNGTRPSHHGNGYSEEGVGYTLNATEQHGIAYGIDRATYNMGCGCPVDTSAEGRSTDRAGRRDQNAQYAISIQEEVEPTMVAKGPGAVAHPTYCTSKSSFHTRASEEFADTLVASDYKDPPTVNDTDDEMEYIVRRLTPTECARLQGFPDWWCSDLASDDPTDEEIARWREIFKEYDEAMGKKTKPKTDNQIRKWLQNPHSDSAEYKLWGNGVSEPIVFFVLSGIKWAVDENIR